MKYRTILLLTWTAIILGACSSNAPQNLATSVPGVWLEAVHQCRCGSSLMTTRECSASDCTEANALVLQGAGVGETLILRWSDTEGTFSAVGGSAAILMSHWKVPTNGGQPQLAQTFDATGTTFMTGVQCSDTKLVRVGKDTYQRAADPLGKVVLATDPNGAWTAVRYR